MSAGYRQTIRHFDRDVRLFLASAALQGFAWDGIRSVIFNLYLLRLGYGPEFVGLANGAAASAFAILCPLAGVLGTRWESRRMLMAGLAVMSAGFGLLPLAEFLPLAWREAWLLSASVLCHLGLALYLVNGLPFTMAITRPGERSHVFSIHMALIPLAAFAGSLLGGALPGISATLLGLPAESALAYGLPLWLAALSFLASALVLLPISPTGDRPRSTAARPPAPPAGPAPWGLMAIVALVMALRFGGRAMVVTFANVYLDEALDISAALIGALTAVAQLVAVPAALVAPLFVARWGSVRTVLWGGLGIALATLPLALIPLWPAAGVGLVGSAAFFSVTVAPLRLFNQELVTPPWRATMASAFLLGAGLAFAASSLVGGFLIAALGYQALFLIGVGLSLVAALLFWAYFRQPRGELARSPAPEPET
jgi:MFS family permease